MLWDTGWAHFGFITLTTDYVRTTNTIHTVLITLRVSSWERCTGIYDALEHTQGALLLTILFIITCRWGIDGQVYA